MIRQFALEAALIVLEMMGRLNFDAVGARAGWHESGTLLHNYETNSGYIHRM